MLIRPFDPADAPALAALFHASVREVGSRHYSPAQVRAWSPSPPDPTDYVRRAAGRTLLVAVDTGGEPVGYVDLEASGHVDHLYCRPDSIGRGVGTALCVAVEDAAARAGIARLFVEASEGARRLFERRGFILDARHDFAIGSTAIHNYRMAKALR